MRGPVSTGFLYPLDVLYARCGVAAPAGRVIAPGRIPAAHSLLRDSGLRARSLPTAFFRVTPNAELLAAFGMARPRPRYGRQTSLMSGDERIGDIVEILAGV